jgi:hypothetical protein
MSNYFPNARPNENITTTLRAINDDPIVVCLVNTSASLTNLREYIISDYTSNPSNYPAYEGLKSLTAVLNKVNMVQVFSGFVQFPNVSSTPINVPASGLTFYGNSNFNSLFVDTSRVILYIK